jgi:hypothetical protein
VQAADARHEPGCPLLRGRQAHRMGQGQAGLRDSLTADGWLDPVADWRFWIREKGTEGIFGDIQEDLGQAETGVKIPLPVSHNVLTKIDVHVQ